MPISEILALSSHIEKLGIIGVLVIACCLLGYAVKYFRAENLSLYTKLDRLKTAYIIVKNAADAADVQYDLSEVKGVDELINHI